MGVVNTTYTFTGTDTVTSSKLNNIIDETTFTNDAIYGSSLAVVTGKIAVKASGISSTEIADNAVTTGKIAGSAVSSDKIATSAVTTAKINNLAVTTEKIADGAVTAAKLANSQTGSAPLYFARAYGSFGTAVVYSNTGNYSKPTSASTTTITLNDHGYETGQIIGIQFESGPLDVSGGSLDKLYVITKINNNEFTISVGLGFSGSGTMRLTTVTPTANGNIHSIAHGTYDDDFGVNFTTNMASSSYVVNANVNTSSQYSVAISSKTQKHFILRAGYYNGSSFQTSNIPMSFLVIE